MITTQYDGYIKNLVRSLEMLWIITLNNGLEIYSDYNRYPGSPWDRLKDYCKTNNLYPVKIRSMMLGAPETIMFDNPNGFDGLFVLRGSSKDIEIETGEGVSMSYKKLIVGVFNNETSKIDVRKFCWPENELEPNTETRLLTKTNFDLMFFKNEQTKNRIESLLFSVNG